ncbi:MAG: hypothetical protein R3313_02710, partial [Candidatus Saccharimonadales bacterium]|nr:hypothetical protein [Candidatus Saccharimonadales bacterium]
MQDDTEILLRKSRRKVLSLTVLPLAIFLILLLLFGIWRFSLSSDDSGDSVIFTKDQPINEISLVELQSLEPTRISINEANQLVVNGELVANEAFVLREGEEPNDPQAGQVYFDHNTNVIRFYDGDNFITLLGTDREADICYIGEDCGFLEPGDIAAASIPSPFRVSTLTENGVLYGNGTAVIQATSAPSAGQIIVGTTGGVPRFRTVYGDATLSASGALNLVANSVGSSELAATSVVAGTYGSGTDYAIFTVNGDGRITSASELPLPGGGGGVTALNTLTGALSLNGTANQINVASGGTTITLSTPQDIAATSSVNFADLALTGNLSVDGNTTLGDAAADTISINGTIQGGTPLIFEGSSADGIETTFAITDPSGVDKTITFPDASGEVSLLGQAISSTEITDDQILVIDLNNTSLPGVGEDGYVATYDNATGGFTWVDPTSIGTDSYTTVQVDGTTESVAAPTLDFDGTDFTVTESPDDDFDITIQDERIEDIMDAAFA